MFIICIWKIIQIKFKEVATIKNYKKIALEDKEIIESLIEQGKSKTYIAEVIGCTRKTLSKALQHLNIDYNYYEKKQERHLNILEDGRFEKECTTCNKIKLMDEFYIDKNSNKYYSACKDCYRDKAKVKYHEKANQLNEYKSKIGCNKCKDKRAYVLDFHHKDPSKKSYTIAANPNVAIDNDKFIEEIAKCVLLCSNCHREFHHLENKIGITIDEYLSK